MEKRQIDSNFKKKNLDQKEGGFSLAQMRKIILNYKLMILGAVITTSCTNNGDFDKSCDISLNALAKNETAEISGIDILKDTLLYAEDAKNTYDYTKFSDSLVVSKKVDTLRSWIEKTPPGFLNDMNLDEIFIQKELRKKSKKTHQVTNPTGLYLDDNLSLTDMDEFPHEMVHKILDEIDFNYDKWATEIYGPNFAEFYGEPVKNKQGYYPRQIGFINNNASRSMLEDWAETIHDLFTKNNWKFFMHDEVLQKKIQSMKKVFFELDKRFNQQYWEDLGSGLVNKDYWKNE